MNILIANESRLVGEGLGMIIRSSFSEATIVVTDLIDNFLIQLSNGAKQPWEVIIIDQKFSGFISPKQLRKLFPKVKVCLLNSRKDSQKKVEYSQKGFNGLIPLSSTPKQIEHTINSLLSGQNIFPKVVNIPYTKPTPIRKKPMTSCNLTLTYRQKEILSMMALGLGNKAIANHYDITESTVKRHLCNIFKKLGVKNRVEAARVGAERKLLLN